MKMWFWVIISVIVVVAVLNHLSAIAVAPFR
jgi:hypothetical protein